MSPTRPPATSRRECAARGSRHRGKRERGPPSRPLKAGAGAFSAPQTAAEGWPRGAGVRARALSPVAGHRSAERTQCAERPVAVRAAVEGLADHPAGRGKDMPGGGAECLLFLAAPSHLTAACPWLMCVSLRHQNHRFVRRGLCPGCIARRE